MKNSLKIRPVGVTILVLSHYSFCRVTVFLTIKCCVPLSALIITIQNIKKLNYNSGATQLHLVADALLVVCRDEIFLLSI